MPPAPARSASPASQSGRIPALLSTPQMATSSRSRFGASMASPGTRSTLISEAGHDTLVEIVHRAVRDRAGYCGSRFARIGPGAGQHSRARHLAAIRAGADRAADGRPVADHAGVQTYADR